MTNHFCTKFIKVEENEPKNVETSEEKEEVKPVTEHVAEKVKNIFIFINIISIFLNFFLVVGGRQS